MGSFSKRASRAVIFVCLMIFMLILTGCGTNSAPRQKVVLFAPFEGRYQEIGYSALYPARLAINEQNPINIELVALDDGGTLDIAIQRAKAIAYDQQIRIVVIQGYLGASAEVLNQLTDKTIIIIGDWGNNSGGHVYHLSNPALQAQFTDPTRLITDPIIPPFVGGETFGLPSFINLQPDFPELTFVSSGGLPSVEFTERILSSAPHATPPNHLSALTYDAISMSIMALNQNAHLSELVYHGLSGQITFSDHHWAEAPIYRYRFDDQGVILVDDAIE